MTGCSKIYLRWGTSSWMEIFASMKFMISNRNFNVCRMMLLRSVLSMNDVGLDYWNAVSAGDENCECWKPFSFRPFFKHKGFRNSSTQWVLIFVQHCAQNAANASIVPIPTELYRAFYQKVQRLLKKLHENPFISINISDKEKFPWNSNLYRANVRACEESSHCHFL